MRNNAYCCSSTFSKLGCPKAGRRAARRGFTLLQILLVVGILAVLSAILFSAFSRASAPARRAKCNVHLKQIALALDTFRQERGKMPQNLSELASEGYVTSDTLICPSDPDEGVHAGDSVRDSYADFYILREPRDSGELPVLVCPFHEKDSSYGVQGFKGGYTKEFAARPAHVSAGDVSGVVTITRPGQGVLSLPVGSQTLELHGGDRIKTGAGTTTIHFLDTSTATVQANSEISVLQSYVDGQRGGPLYTLVRQFAGRCNYYVNPGNRFDVATPTATAGALGTKFTIDLVSNSLFAPSTKLETVLKVNEHVVAFSTVERTIEVEDTEPAVAAHDPKNKLKLRLPRGSKEEKDHQKNLSLTSGNTSGSSGSNSGGSGSNSGSND